MTTAEAGRAAASGGAAGGMLRTVRRIAAGLCAVGLALACGFALFAQHVSTLTEPRLGEPADAIIVLTGGQARLDAAVDLLRDGKGKRLLISGVNPAAGPDALRAATGADRRLFNCCVDIDHAALDTVGNAEESAKWVKSHDYGRVILVTNNYHMPRSMLEMGRLIDDTQLIPYPVVNSNLANGGWITRPDAVRVLFTEYAKYLAALGRSVVPVRQTAQAYGALDAGATGALR